MIELLTTIAATDSYANESTGIQALGLDPLAILAQAVTFLVLFVIVKKFALDKIVAVLEERRKTIDKGVRLGLEMQAEKERLSQIVEEELHKTRLEADKIIAVAHEESGVIIKSAEAKAAAKVETMMADARARIEDDMREARRTLEKEIVGLVAAATEVIIQEKLDRRKDAALIKRLLGESLKK